MQFNLPWEGPPISFKACTLERNPCGSPTYVPFKVKSVDKRKEVSLTGLADTGSTYSTVPDSVISELALPYLGDTPPIILLSGETMTARSFVGIIEVEGREVGTVIIPCQDNLVVIGVTALEQLGFKVNPATGKLEPTAVFG